MAAEDPPGRSGGCLFNAGMFVFWSGIGAAFWAGAIWAAAALR